MKFEAVVNNVKIFLKKFRSGVDESNPENVVFFFGLKTKDEHLYKIFLDVKKKPDFILMYAILDEIKIPPNKLSLMSEMITKINYGLILGNFELNFEDGELRFKFSTTYQNLNVDTNFVDKHLRIMVATCEKHYKQFKYFIELPSVDDLLNSTS